MSEIEKRRRIEAIDSSRAHAVYRIDRSLFGKDGDVIQLPNPKGVGSDLPDWIYVELRRDVLPFISASLYKTICRLGYFAFAYIERWKCNSVPHTTIHVVITKNSFDLYRDDVNGPDSSDGTIFVTDSRHAEIWFYDDGICDGYDYFGRKFGAETGFKYRFIEKDGWIDENKSSLAPFRLVEFSLLEHSKQSD